MNTYLSLPFIVLLVLLASAIERPVSAAEEPSSEGEDTELVKKTLNPVANLISVPIQNNWDFGIGPADAMRYTANIQPVIPISLNHDWNLITRTILPVIYQESPAAGIRSAWGLG